MEDLDNAIALDYHIEHELIFWSDVTLDRIKRVFTNGTGIMDVISSGLDSPGKLILDINSSSLPNFFFFKLLPKKVNSEDLVIRYIKVKNFFHISFEVNSSDFHKSQPLLQLQNNV